MLCRRVPMTELPIHFFRHFCSRMHSLAAIIAAGCIVQPQHIAKNGTAKISASGIAMGSVVT